MPPVFSLALFMFFIDIIFSSQYNIFVNENTKIKDFVTPYAHDCRKRHRHHRYKDKIVGFVVQLEIFINGHWYPVIRYDTAHGVAHCDILHFSGKIEKIKIPTLDYKEALTYADDDLNENWQTYRQRYLKEIVDE